MFRKERSSRIEFKWMWNNFDIENGMSNMFESHLRGLESQMRRKPIARAAENMKSRCLEEITRTQRNHQLDAYY